MPRIIVMQQATSRDESLLHAVAEAAARLESELQGLFVEDADLFHLAGMPYACEVCFPSATRRGMDVASLERSLRQLADQARRDLEAAARQRAMTASFRVARGSPLGEMLAAASDTDIVVASTLAPGQRAATLSVICTTAASPDRVARLLRDLAPRSEDRVLVVLRDAQAADVQEWEGLLRDALEGTGIARHLQLYTPADERELAGLLRDGNLA